MAQRITGHIRLIGLIADPIRHSKSPMMHNTAFEALGLDYVYLAFELGNDSLEDAVRGLKALDARADSRIEEIIAGGSSIVPVSDDMRTQMRQRTVDLYQQIRKVVADDELFFAYCGRVFEGETMY